MEQDHGNFAFLLIFQGEIFGRYTADPVPNHPALASITSPSNKTDGILDKRSGAVSVIQDLTGFQITPTTVFSFATSVIYEAKGHRSCPYLKWVPLEKADGLLRDFYGWWKASTRQSRRKDTAIVTMLWFMALFLVENEKELGPGTLG